MRKLKEYYGYDADDRTFEQKYGKDGDKFFEDYEVPERFRKLFESVSSPLKEGWGGEVDDENIDAFQAGDIDEDNFFDDPSEVDPEADFESFEDLEAGEFAGDYDYDDENGEFDYDAWDDGFGGYEDDENAEIDDLIDSYPDEGDWDTPSGGRLSKRVENTRRGERRRRVTEETGWEPEEDGARYDDENGNDGDYNELFESRRNRRRRVRESGIPLAMIEREKPIAGKANAWREAAEKTMLKHMSLAEYQSLLA
jgi:hypothetical protein